MKVPMNFHSAELHVSSLCQTIVDAMVQAGADPENTLPKLEEAVVFSHELARFVDSVKEAIAAEIPVTVNDDSAEQRPLRVARAAQNVTRLRTFGDAERVIGLFSNQDGAA